MAGEEPFGSEMLSGHGCVILGSFKVLVLGEYGGYWGFCGYAFCPYYFGLVMMEQCWRRSWGIWRSRGEVCV